MASSLLDERTRKESGEMERKMERKARFTAKDWLTWQAYYQFAKRDSADVAPEVLEKQAVWYADHRMSGCADKNCEYCDN